VRARTLWLWMIPLSVGLTGCGDSNRSVEVRSLRQSEWQGHTELAFAIAARGRAAIPALLLMPRGGEGPLPVVLAMHGLTGRKDEWIEVDGYSKGGNVSLALLSRGYAVLAIDLPLHGERTEAANPDEQRRQVLADWGAFFASPKTS
jgi:pimeloyl-ACP methyl ester carboxylesterase